MIGAFNFFFERHLSLTALRDLRSRITSGNHSLLDHIRGACNTDSQIKEGFKPFFK